VQLTISNVSYKYGNFQVLSITAKRPTTSSSCHCLENHWCREVSVGCFATNRPRCCPPSALHNDTTQLSPTPFQTNTVTCYVCTTEHAASLQSSLHKRHKAVLAVVMGFDMLKNLLNTSISARKLYKKFSTYYVH
jgi:hypothetical protein